MFSDLLAIWLGIGVCAFVGNNIMEGISDPETFELSETVEKSSKSGIFTNKRLLMIKDGFLYYFSNVPAEYKGHEPNLMSSLKEFPKCSIQIRSIQTIKLESAKSSTLIITFYDKDMIDREDIRKSLSSKNYSHPVKPNKEDLQEWKFIFATVMKCRLWYGSLIKLKQYFVKSQDKFDKFAEYMANFDPQIRSSLPQRASASNLIPSPTNNTNNNLNSNQNQNLSPSPNQSSKANGKPVMTSAQSKYKLEKESGIFQIQESNQEYDEQVTPKNKISKFEAKEIKFPEPQQVKPVQIKAEKLEDPQKDNKKEQKVQNSHENLIVSNAEPLPTTIQPTITIEHPKQQGLPFQMENEPKQVKQVVSEDIIVNIPTSYGSISSNEVSIAEGIRREEALRAQEQAVQLAQQQELIRKMTQELENSRKAKEQLEERVRQEQEKAKEEQQRRLEEENLRIILERQKKEEEEYRRLQESVRSDSPGTERQVRVREESIHTEYERQREMIEVMEGGKRGWKERRSSFKSDLRNSIKSDLRNSVKSELSLNPLAERDTLNFFRNTISYISEVKIDPQQVESYDYFWEIGQIYRSSDIKERIRKELQLAEFVGKASRKATDLVVQYIDINRPRESIRIDRNMFEIEIVCQRGRVIRTEGSERLVYPNENHQRLKRCFKILNHLNDLLLALLKRKPHCPLRVPFACLVEYKGYTALAKMVPPLRDHSLHTHHLKLLGPSLPLYNLSLQDFECHSATYGLVQPTIHFKVTKEDETCLLRVPEKSFDFLTCNRRTGISLASKKMFQEANQVQINAKERLELASIITFCRELKKIMKANTPFTDDPNRELQFFQDFLSNPSAFLEEASTQQSITGLLLHYIQRLLGIRMKSKFKHNKNENESEGVTYIAVPVQRKFTLCSLDVSAFAGNFQRYLSDKKYEHAQKALNYSKQLEEDYAETLLRQAHLYVSKGQCQQALERLQLSLQMLGIHDPRRLTLLQLQAQCLEAVGEVGQALGTLRTLLQEAEYSLGSSSRLIWVYFLIADLLGRQGLTSQLIQVYRRILRESPESRQRVLLDFARSLSQDSDPHVLLDFLQKELPEATQQQHPQVQQLLGELYLRAKNRPKALGFFSAAFSNMSEWRQLERAFQVFRKGMACCGSGREKKAFHRQVISRLGAVGEDQQWRSINTHVCCVIGEGFSEGERDNLIIFLECSQTYTPARLLQWSWLQTVLRKVACSENPSQQQKATLINNIDKDIFSESLILLNSPNLL